MTVESIASLTEDEAERLTLRISLKLGTLADSYESVRPLIRQAIEGDAATALGYTGLSEYVSDRFGGTLARLGVETRREVVRELTWAGLSTRAIAPIVGVSQKTVDRDARESYDSPESLAKVTETTKTETYVNTDTGEVAPPPVTGLDGKKYTRPKPKPVSELDDQAASIRATNMIFGQIIPQLYGVVHDPERFLSTYDPADNPNAKSAHMLFTPEALHRMADQLHNLAALMEENPHEPDHQDRDQRDRPRHRYRQGLRP